MYLFTTSDLTEFRDILSDSFSNVKSSAINRPVSIVEKILNCFLFESQQFKALIQKLNKLHRKK